MFKQNKRFISVALALFMVLGIMFPSMAFADAEEVHLTILGTTDIHGNIYNWSYEDNKETDNSGLAKVYSVVESVRKENPNTILIDNGDTVQGTILSDDLYNARLELKNPVIDVMNFMKYDSMTLGNHEFNFGLELVDKIIEEAEFPILAGNATYKEDGSYLVEPYTVVEVAGVKVGIVGLTNPNIPKWDGPKVTNLDFEGLAGSAEKVVKELKANEDADLIVASVHAGFNEDYGDDGASAVIDRVPEIAALLIGHDHVQISEKYKDTVVGAVKDTGGSIVRFDLKFTKENDAWVLVDNQVSIIDVLEYEASEELKEYAKEYHNKTIEFINEVIGVATEDFIPESEIVGIPEAQIRDTAVIDLINNVQLEATDADIAGAALFQQNSNIKAGDITYSNIFDIYKYPNTLIGVEVNGLELKNYMEWSASYYNTFKEGDVNISFSPDIRGYNYDMFQGLDYKVDISKPVGERIVELKFNGEEVKDTDTFKLAINNYRYGGLKAQGIISGEPYFESDPKSLRAYIADYIREKGEISPEFDDNWEVIGAEFNHPLRDYVIEEINKGTILVPTSEDGRSYNAKAINIHELTEEGLIPEELLREEIPVEPQPAAPEVKQYEVKKGDVLWRIGIMHDTTWQVLAEFNKLTNPHLIYPGQLINIPY